MNRWALALVLSTVVTESAPDPELMARARAAVGDAAAVGELRGFRLKGEVMPLPDGAAGHARVTLDLRGAMREEIQDAAGTQRTWRSGRLAWQGAGRGAKELSIDAGDEVHARYFALCAPVLMARTAPDSCDVLGVTPEGWTRLGVRLEGKMRIRVDVEPETGRVRRVADAREETGVEWELDDFRKTEGIVWPYRMTRIEDGRPTSETVWERFERADDLEPKDLLPGSIRSDL